MHKTTGGRDEDTGVADPGHFGGRLEATRKGQMR